MALVYSCCFWFSLRLGGILIASFCLFQGGFTLTSSCLAYTYAAGVEAQLREWSEHWELMFYEEYVGNVMQDSKKYSLTAIGVSCIYLLLCAFYIYGAYICNNILMFGFITIELLRLILVSVLVSTGLMLLKHNTMDIGSLIGASVVGGFFLLGMFYLWVCAASLPVLINEMERDEQAATIAKLQQLLDTDQGLSRKGGSLDQPNFSAGVFIVRTHRGPRIPVL